MGFITVHQKWGKKRGDKLQNFRPSKVFHNSNFVNWEFYWEEAITVWVTHISIQLDFLYNSHIFLTSSFFSQTLLQITVCIFPTFNIKLNSISFAIFLWIFAILLRILDPSKRYWGQQTENRNLFAAKHWWNENIKLGILRLFLTAKLWFWLRGIWSSEGLTESINIGDEKINLEWTGLGDDSCCMAWSKLFAPQVL